MSVIWMIWVKVTLIPSFQLNEYDSVSNGDPTPSSEIYTPDRPASESSDPGRKYLQFSSKILLFDLNVGL